MKLTDEQIIKALECCTQEDYRTACKDCPCDDMCYTDLKSIDKFALDLINRLKAEIEKLNVELVGMRGACESYKMHYDNARAENESLKEALKDLKKEMSYMSSPNTIGDRHEMGCW